MGAGPGRGRGGAGAGGEGGEREDGVESTAAAAARRAAHLREAGAEEGLLLPALLDEVDQDARGVRGDLGAHPLGGDRERHLDRRVLREGDRVG